jgi:hypothetical protein
MPTETQTKDGKWIPAQPIPYYKDSRPWSLKIWHMLLSFRIDCIQDRNKRHRRRKCFNIMLDMYMVPVEPYTDDNGKWHSW